MTVTSEVPKLPAGAVAVIVVALVTVNVVAEVAPNLTAVVAVNPVPVIVMDVPPAGRPAAGLTPETVGTEV